ncbi:MAG: M23 family metallopeptidase [bacterium]|nr:M23 family metallopeptidase [bacterium]
MFTFFIGLIIGTSALIADTSPISVEVRPGKVYIATSDSGQHLNFDFLLRNTSDQKVMINKVELSVFDAADKLAWRDFYDEYGRPSLELTRNPSLAPKGTALFYNPFHTLPKDIPLERLKFEFSFSTEDRLKTYSAVIEVKPVSFVQNTDLILPLKGRVLVWDGYDYNSHHRRVDYTQNFFEQIGQKTNFQRYAIDFVIVDEAGQHYRGRTRTNNDWYRNRPDEMTEYLSYGVPVFAAGAGKVVAVRDDSEDRKFDPKALASDERAFYGNYVVIDHLNGEFSLYGHIKKGSALVKAGNTVKQGVQIASVGAAGSSLFPHLHFELRDGSGARTVEGLPSYFSNYKRILGSSTKSVKRGSINTGEIVTR